jgi:magnesium transporter
MSAVKWCYLRRFDELPHQTDKIFVLDANEACVVLLPQPAGVDPEAWWPT